MKSRPTKGWQGVNLTIWDTDKRYLQSEFVPMFIEGNYFIKLLFKRGVGKNTKSLLKTSEFSNCLKKASTYGLQ